MSWQWQRNVSGQQCAHGYVDGRRVCHHREDGVSGAVMSEDIGPHGLPYGRVCTTCHDAHQRFQRRLARA